MTAPAARTGRAPWRLLCAVLLLACGAPELAAAGAAVPAPLAEPYLQAISPDLLPRLERERFVMLPSDAAAPGLTQGLVVFSQPPDQVWRLLVQTERQHAPLPCLGRLASLRPV